MTLKKLESQLTKWLAGVEKIENSLNLQFISITSIATESTVGISNLVRNLNLKKEVVLTSVSSLLELQLKVSNKDLLNSLRRRIMQLKGTISYSRNFPKSSHSLSCFNSNSLSWDCALETLIDREKSGIYVGQGDVREMSGIFLILLKSQGGLSHTFPIFFLSIC